MEMLWKKEPQEFDKIRKLKPIEMVAQKLSYSPILCSNTYEETSISAFGDNSGTVFFIDTKPETGNIVGTDYGVSNSSIFDLCWSDARTFAVASGELDLITVDLVTFKKEKLKGHQKTIKCLKRHENRLFSGGGDGKVILWEPRTGKPGVEMFLEKKAKNRISAIDFHKTETNLIFATSTPGCTLNTWDIRYTQRGLHLAKNRNISKNIANDIYHHGKYLFYTLCDGSLLRTTETGDFMDWLAPSDSYDLKTGKIDFDSRASIILVGTSEKIICCDVENPKKREIYNFGRTNGICSVFRQHFITYDDFGDIRLFEFSSD